MNFTRRLFFNVLFFGLLLIVLAGDRAAAAAAPLLDRTTLVIAPEGKLVEQFTSDPCQPRAGAHARRQRRRAKCSCATCCARSTRRKDDKRIERVLLRTDRMEFSGYRVDARSRRGAATLPRDRASRSSRSATNFDQSQYLLAAQAERGLPRSDGRVDARRPGRYRQYYREGPQDKLGVDVHLFRVGEYKSAAEPYILDAASPASKEADLLLDERHLAALPRRHRRAAQAVARSSWPADIDTLPQGIAGRARRPRPVRAAAEAGRRPQDARRSVDDLLTARGVADGNATTASARSSFDDYLRARRQRASTPSTASAGRGRRRRRRDRRWQAAARQRRRRVDRGSCCATRAKTTTSRPSCCA